jgi:quinohemoprotein ethanol dehydrogenase
MAYDPALDLLYVGTGNGGPYPIWQRSPGGGDNLYLSSILALRPDTGELVWHYQETPGDTRDYTATQHIVLAELPIDGAQRRVLLHAPKNGFFYVIDRETGKLLSAENFAEVNWAERIDLSSGRPVETSWVDFRRRARVALPSPFGAHNWQPMAFHPRTGLVYIPAQEIPGLLGAEERFEHRPGLWNTAMDTTVMREFPRDVATGALLAWDPVAQREVWRVDYTGPWNGGLLATAGNLVFQGTSDRRFVAYAADSGRKLWELPMPTGVIAPPVTYELDGEQFVAVLAGWGGAMALAGGDAVAALDPRPGGYVLAFKLGGRAALPPAAPLPAKRDPGQLPPPPPRGLARKGEALFAEYCVHCHGYAAVSGGVTPDLRHSPPEVHANFAAIVLHGARVQQGMPAFSSWLSPEDVEAIHAFVIQRAHDEARTGGNQL